ncbi:hypothetical protein INS49_010469 [Diaporthe citri]|uniref:uncharacterized protein n=1 Tax=Diaporthe citri TaxID=83186 RepID=UPI001C7E9D11|nr:uncharacterized protein INS49_010469 [Diaporthe citri]KAG6362239.1 hypothetical protein INS49_010469 [Diaporthe citri]
MRACKLYAIPEILLLSRHMPFGILLRIGFTCRTGVNRATDPFACASTYTSDTYVSVMFYKFTSASGLPDSVNTSSTTTTFMVQGTEGYYIEANGPVVRRSDGDPEWSTTSLTTTDTRSINGQTGTGTSNLPTSTSEPASPGGGLSVGASAGIGVGVAIGCIIFISCIVAAYIIGKRRRKAAAQGPDGPKSPPYRDGIPVQGQSTELTGSEYKPRELPGGGHQQVPEMDGHGHRSEMDANNHPIELQASEGHGLCR